MLQPSEVRAVVAGMVAVRADLLRAIEAHRRREPGALSAIQYHAAHLVWLAVLLCEEAPAQ